jgi:hypothetical protein
MSDCNPYIEVCICDSYGAKNIVCMAVFQRTDDKECGFQVTSDTGSEHGEIVVFSAPPPTKPNMLIRPKGRAGNASITSVLCVIYCTVQILYI